MAAGALLEPSSFPAGALSAPSSRVDLPPGTAWRKNAQAWAALTKDEKTHQQAAVQRQHHVQSAHEPVVGKKDNIKHEEAAVEDRDKVHAAQEPSVSKKDNIKHEQAAGAAQDQVQASQAPVLRTKHEIKHEHADPGVHKKQKHVYTPLA